MQNLYPLFERNRILKKELLWALRDYTFSHVQLEYQEYGQGILRGCEVQVQGGELVVEPGIIKYGSFICLMMDEYRIEYMPSEQIQYLKLKIEIDRRLPDCITYQIELLLNSNEEQNENEFELCRFNLRKGARLRDYYKDFLDMKTEYDTINLLHADWAGVGGSSIAPAIMRYFAELVLANENSLEEDRTFSYLIMSQAGALPIKVLSDYSGHRTGKPPEDLMESEKIYKSLCIIIEIIQKDKGKGVREKKERHRILVD